MMISKGDATILLSGLILNHKLYSIAVEKLDEPIFDPGAQFAHDFIWKQFSDMSAEAGEPVPMSMLSARLSDALEELVQDEFDWSEDINELFFHIKENVGEPPSEDYVLDLMQQIINNQLKRSSEELLDNILSREDPKNVQTKLGEEMRKLITGKQIKGGVMDSYVRPFAALEDMMVCSKAWPTGVSWFDEITGGGIRTSLLWGFLAPPSGGKTTFAVHIGTSWIKQGSDHHTVLFMYEQPPEGDITSRLLSQATGESVNVFKDKTLDQLSADVRERVMVRASELSNRLHVFDFSKPGTGFRGFADIEEALNTLGLIQDKSSVDTDKVPPVLVIVDWLIPFFQRRMTEEGAIAVGQDLRGYGTKFMDEIKAYKNRYNVTININHQIKPKAAAASAARAPDFNDAAEWGGFAWMLDDCFGVGSRTDDDIAILASTKARTNARSKIFVRLEGEYARFVDVSNDYMVTNGKMVKKSMALDKGKTSSTSALTKRLLAEKKKKESNVPTDVVALSAQFKE